MLQKGEMMWHFTLCFYCSSLLSKGWAPTVYSDWFLTTAEAALPGWVGWSCGCGYGCCSDCRCISPPINSNQEIIVKPQGLEPTVILLFCSTQYFSMDQSECKTYCMGMQNIEMKWKICYERMHKNFRKMSHIDLCKCLRKMFSKVEKSFLNKFSLLKVMKTAAMHKT